MLSKGISLIPACLPPWWRGPAASKQPETQFQPVPTSVLPKNIRVWSEDIRFTLACKRTQSTILKLPKSV